MVGNHFVPSGTAVQVPPYVYHRSSQYFSPSPDKFWPGRWLQRPDTEKSKKENTADGSSEENTIHNQAAFIPFAFGPANCVGKHFAMIEMRMVIASLMQKFDVRFAEGYDPAEWEANLEDFFVMKKGPLPVVLTPRL